MTLETSLQLAHLARSVDTRQDLVAFVAALRDDLESNRDEWENADLVSFLDSMAAWIEGIEGYYGNTGQKLADLSPWRVLADVLMGARMHE